MLMRWYDLKNLERVRLAGLLVLICAKPYSQFIEMIDLLDVELVPIRKWLFSPISELGSNFNPRNT